MREALSTKISDSAYKVTLVEKTKSFYESADSYNPVTTDFELPFDEIKSLLTIGIKTGNISLEEAFKKLSELSNKAEDTFEDERDLQMASYWAGRKVAYLSAISMISSVETQPESD